MPKKSSAPAHPDLDALRVAFTERLLRCPSGVVEVDAASLILYYGQNQSSRRLDLTQASDDDLKGLADSCAPATFGRNQEDVHDETYRKAGVLDTAQFAIGFDPAPSGIIASIEELLLEGHDRSKTRLAHELYKLNVYGPGQFFKAHKDTPRAENMVASLVVVLPTTHEGGKLELKHEDHTTTFDSAALLSKASRRSVAFVAFFGDVIHEVTPVTAGYRITLTYNLYLNDTGSTVSPSSDVQRSALQTALTKAIENPDLFPKGGYIGFALRHEYALDNASRKKVDVIKPYLKGSDAVLAAVSKSLGLETSIWMAYEEDEGHQPLILCKSKAKMPDWELQDGWVDVLLKWHKGRWAQEAYNSSRSLRVQWATEIESGHVPFKEGFIAYGNQASMSFLYGRLCLLVRVGPVGNRRGAPAVEPVDPKGEDYYRWMND